ncbi:hypothetical protein EV714DRAFT_271924 [Schizophyllum commune]
MTATLQTREIPDVRRRISQVERDEQWWVDHRAWLENRGYLLRPRFTPGWQPSWHDPKVSVDDAEDRFPADKPNILDAIKLPHGEPVMLKRVNKRYSKEVEISAMLSSPPLSKDSRNHCVPIYDILEVPDDEDTQIMVLPLLRRYNDPPFDTVGEVIDCLRQVLEVNYGQIRVYDELTLFICYDDPFANDVYCLGTWIRDDFLKETSRYKHLEILEPLVDELTRDDPVKRPTMKEVMTRFEGAIGLLSPWKLRSRALEQEDGPQGCYQSGSHWIRRLTLTARRRPAVPSAEVDGR